MYAQRGHGKRSSFYSDYTFGVWREGALTPVGKAYFGFTDEELKQLDKFVRDHTVERFGPVRAVAPALVLEVAFEGLQRSTRHKSGVAMRACASTASAGTSRRARPMSWSAGEVAGSINLTSKAEQSAASIETCVEKMPIKALSRHLWLRKNLPSPLHYRLS